MYRLLNNTPEDRPASRLSIDLRIDHAINFVAVIITAKTRLESAPGAVSLTAAKVSSLDSAAFEVRWTSLAA